MQLHLGGGTPTYLSISELRHLLQSLNEQFTLSPDGEYSIELDPRVTTPEHLTLLRKHGFNRLSLGVQDFSHDVQAAVNRIQSFEQTSNIITYARELGFRSINLDLIYGLPLQNRENFRSTLELVLQLSPERIALFNFAYLPSTHPFQRK